jgi:hypothetical protein
MKNYLIKSLNRIKSTYWGPDLGDRGAREGDIYPFYEKMHAISESSFHHLLQGDWEYIFLSAEVEDVPQTFRDQFFEIYEIWKEESCNILYCGPDTQMVQPTEVFGKYKNFMMWNYTDPKSYLQFPHYLNADIRYYPAEMTEECWNVGFDRAKEITQWNDDQVIYNDMVWSQGLTPQQVIDPTMAFQGFMLPQDYDYAESWNGCAIGDVKIIHWHGSRDARAKLAAMESIQNQLGLPLSV